MIHAQIQLSPDQHRRLKERAVQKGLSVAALIRQAVDQSLAREGQADPWDRLLQASGSIRGKARIKDLGRGHDRQLRDAFAL